MSWLTSRWLLLPAYCVYLLAVLFLVLSPRPDAAGAGIDTVLSLLHRGGLWQATAQRVEVGLNVVLFIPLGLIGVLLWPRLWWWLWGPIGLAFSGFLEGFQAQFLPHRTATGSDLLANTWGSVIGMAVGYLLLRELRLTADRATRRPPVLPRPALTVLIGLVLVGAAVFVLGPTDELPTGAVLEISGWFADAGAEGWLASATFWERFLNVLLFVPLGVVGMLVRPGWSVLRWGIVGFVLSLAIETTQWLWLPGRTAQFSDLVTNTLGMFAGAGLVRLLIR